MDTHSKLAVVKIWTIIVIYTCHSRQQYNYYKQTIKLSDFYLVIQVFYIQTVKYRMQLEKVRAVFERKGYTQMAYIDKRQYIRVLNSLMAGGGLFHQEVAEQLWSQAVGERPSGQVRVNDICNTIVEAQNILKIRIQQSNTEINNLEFEKRKLQSSINTAAIRKIQQIDARLQQLYGERQSFEEDYKLVTEPFGITISSGRAGQSYGSVAPHYEPSYAGVVAHDSDNTSSPKYDGYTESEQLKFVLYLTLVFGFLEIIIIYGKSDFLNLIVLTCLLSIYLMNFFDRPYIRLTLVLIATSVALDIVWLVMYAGPKWSPQSVSNNTIYQIGYMRFIIFFTIALIPLKIGLFFFLFKHRNANTDEKYIISLGALKILLSASKTNPISKSLANETILSA